MSSLLNKSTFKADWETRSENLTTDMLQLLERGDFYDCTFQVSSKPGGQDKKEFKRHKVLLSTASCVFSKMLFGHFKGAHLDMDEPIVLEGVSPEAFECAMRFLYGQERKFASLEIANMEVYKLAHEMQITSLLHAVEQELLKNIDEIKALQLFNLFVQLENHEGLNTCKQCLHCSKTFSTLKAKFEHQVERVCSCEQHFRCHSHFARHVRIRKCYRRLDVDVLQAIRCNTCGLAFQTPWQMQLHLPDCTTDQRRKLESIEEEDEAKQLPEVATSSATTRLIKRNDRRQCVLF